MKLYMDLTLRYLRENKRRTIITIIGVILSTSLICGVGNIFESFMDYQIRATINRNGAFHVVYNDIESDKIKYLENNAEIEKIGLSTNLGYAIINKEENKIVRVKEYDDNAFEGYDINLIEGRFPKNDGEIVISESVIDKFEQEIKLNETINLNIGNRISTSGESLIPELSRNDEIIEDSVLKEYKVVGIIEKPGFEGGNIGTLISYVENLDYVNVSCILKNPKEAYTKAKEIAKDSGIEIDKITYNDNLLNLVGKSKYVNVNTTIYKIVFIVTFLVIICTISTVYNAFSISTLERKKQFGILSSIGATKRQIKNMVLFEGLIISLFAIPIGLLCATFAIDLLFKFISLYFKDSYIATMNLKLVYSPKIIFISIIIVLSTIFISVIVPARNASKVSPLEAIKNSNEIKLKKVKCPKFIQKLFKTEGVLAYKNIKRNKRRYRSVIISLVMSILIFISFSGFMKIFINAFEVESKVLNYNIELYSSSSKNSENILKELDKMKLENKIKNYAIFDMYQNRVKIDISEENTKKEYKDILDTNLEKETKEGKTFYKMVNAELNFPGDSYIENINLIDGEFDKQRAIEENGVILVNKSFYREKYKKGEITLTNYKVGDTIKVSIDDFNTNETFEAYLKIMAITEDKIIKSDNYKYVGLDFITYDEVSNNLGMTLDKNSIYIDSSEKNLDNIIEIATKNSWSYINQIEEYKALKQEITVISIFAYGFIAVISLVSATNIINTISTNIILRKRELAIIKSIGVDKFGFNRMIYLESILYALTSLIYGISLGVIFSLLMNFIIGDIVVFDIVLPIKAIIISIFAVFIIVFVSAYIPMRKLNDKNIIENILKENI